MGEAIDTESAAAAWLESVKGRLREYLSWSAPPRAAAHVGYARDLVLSPGMPVEVFVRTGESSLLSYLAKPLTDFLSRSLREE